MATLGCDLNPRLRLDVMTGYGRNKGGFFIYWEGLQHPFSNGSDPHGYQTRSLFRNTYVFPSLSYILNERMMLLIKGRINQTRSEDHLRNVIENVELPEAFRSSTAMTHGGEAQFNWQIHRQGILVMGCDLQKDAVHAIQFDSCEVAKAAYYVQFEHRFRDRLKLTLGARYDMEDAEQIGKSGDLSKKLGLNYTLTPATYLRFSYGEGFRMPTVGERFVSTFTSGLRIAPNYDLKPERSTSIETGVHQNLSKSMGIDAAFFYNRYNNLIEPQLDASTGGTNEIVVRFQNVEEARVQGIDLSFRTDWFSKLVSSRIGYTFADSKDFSPGKDYGKPLKYRSRHTLYITNEIGYSCFTLGMDFRYLSQIERVDDYHKVYIKDIDRVVPTYVVALRFGYSWKRLSLNLIVDNLLQYNYLISPANMAPPRTAILQLGLNY
jgi:outer membrane cobalamin receptor